MGIGEILGAVALILFLGLVNKIAESISRKKKERREKKETAQETAAKPVPARRFEIPPPSAADRGGHQFTEAYPGEYIHDTPYLPAHIRSNVTKRCRFCGCREKPLLGPEDLPAGKEVPKELKERLERYGKIRDMSQQELQDLIGNPDEDLVYRFYAAETITDEARILQLLRESHTKDPATDDTPVWTRLIWQLRAAPDGGPFESIAADPAYPIGARRVAVTRILDPEALDRLGQEPDLAEACEKQRPEAICRDGHDWKVIGTKIEAHDSYRMNSPYWVVDTYRCTRCGKTKKGEMYKRMTSPYEKDD